jgi:uncharacterized protein (DUF2126 family)
MAAQPIPIEPGTIEIDERGRVSGEVTIDNGGSVRFLVSKYRGDDQVCQITISANNVSWHHSDTGGGNTIKVGGGGPMAAAVPTGPSSIKVGGGT